MLSYNIYKRYYFNAYRKIAKYKYITYKSILKKIHIKWKIYEYNRLCDNSQIEEDTSNRKTHIVWKKDLEETRYF